MRDIRPDLLERLDHFDKSIADLKNQIAKLEQAKANTAAILQSENDQWAEINKVNADLFHDASQGGARSGPSPRRCAVPKSAPRSSRS